MRTAPEWRVEDRAGTTGSYKATTTSCGSQARPERHRLRIWSGTSREHRGGLRSLQTIATSHPPSEFRTVRTSIAHTRGSTRALFAVRARLPSSHVLHLVCALRLQTSILRVTHDVGNPSIYWVLREPTIHLVVVARGKQICSIGASNHVTDVNLKTTPQPVKQRQNRLSCDLDYTSGLSRLNRGPLTAVCRSAVCSQKPLRSSLSDTG